MKCVAVFGVVGLFLISNSFCGPVAILDNDILDSSEEDDGSPILDDDMTTRSLARLSSAATCLVAGIEYTHGQQIYRRDPCEFCLCLDGEMFCWWQDCPPALEGPCKNQGPFSACDSIPVAPTSKPKRIFSKTPAPSTSAPKFSTTKTTKKFKKTSEPPATQSTTEEEDKDISSTKTIATDATLLTNDTEITETDASFITSTEEPKSCIVMGQEYQVGDNLPHSTGNCLECICGPGGKISCSPHQCVPAGDEINDYRLPELRQGNDVFK